MNENNENTGYIETAILTSGFRIQDLNLGPQGLGVQSFRMVVGLQGFRFWKKNTTSPAQGFEHVKGCAGSDAGKRGVCSVHV